MAFNQFQVLLVEFGGFSGEIPSGPDNNNMICVFDRCHASPVRNTKTVLSAVSPCCKPTSPIAYVNTCSIYFSPPPQRR